MISLLVATVLVQLTTSQWLVGAAELRATLDVSASASPATSSTMPVIFDARDERAFGRGHLPNAVRIDWKDFRVGWGRTGKLTANTDDLARKLAALGVDDRRPVVVYGAARDGWGEEGRIAWMLHYLGHANVRMLDGGYQAWVAVRGATTTERAPIQRGRFTPVPRPAVRAMLADVERAVGVGAVPRVDGASRAVVLDVRPRDEWDGARHYFEPRTGHIPGAVRFDWRDLMDGVGRTRQATVLLPLLAARGVRPDRPVIVYCTGGVRSAEAFWLLRSLGFADVRNFDGSWYEWAFDKSKPVAVGGADMPLTVPPLPL